MINHYSLRKVFLLFLSLIFTFQLSAGGTAEEVQKGPITVGSKIDTEGALLGQIIVLMLEAEGFSVMDRTQTGATPIVREAITSGEIDIYPEYTGNGFYFFSGMTEASAWKTAQSAWETVKTLDYDTNKIVWLRSAPANNTWAIAIRNDLATGENLVSLDDLADYVNLGGEFKIAASEEFVSSEAALPSFEMGYGFNLSEDQMLVFSTGNTALTEQAAALGTDGVNAAMAYGTDGQLAALGLVVLEDPRGIQPVYEPAPIIRESVLDKYPDIETILEPVFKSLDLVTLQKLNGKIAVNGEDPRSVAQAYLEGNNFIK